MAFLEQIESMDMQQSSNWAILSFNLYLYLYLNSSLR